MKTTIQTILVSLGLAMACVGCTITTSSGALTTKNVRFATTEKGETVRSNATFKPGETAWILFDVASFKKDPAGKAHVQEDLVVLGPDGKEVLNKKNLLDFNEDAKGGDVLNLNNHLDLPAGFPGGSYSITMTIRDVVGNSTTTTNTKMTVEGAPAPTGTPAPETPAP